MKNIFIFLLLSVSLVACQKKAVKQLPPQVNFENKEATLSNFTNLIHGKTYLPVYSHIYNYDEHSGFNLTTTVSIRNISTTDSIYILHADYYNTFGINIRQYLKKPIFLKPLETVEIIIAERDVEGGSGANFIFDWAVKNKNNTPLFEAVMISTHGQQGLSFSTRGVQVFE